MSGWVGRWKPSWIPVGESFQNACLEEWIYIGDDSSDEQGMANFPTLVQVVVTKIISKQKLPEEAPPAPRSAVQPDALPWKPIGPQGTASFWERTVASLLPLRPKCNVIHPKLSPFPERLELLFPSEEILSSFEDIVSSGTDQFTAWVKTDPHATLERHMVDAQKATADFGEASERRHETSSQAYRFNKNCLIVRPCRSVSASTTGIQRPDAERKMPVEKQSRRQVARHHVTRSI